MNTSRISFFFFFLLLAVLALGTAGQHPEGETSAADAQDGQQDDSGSHAEGFHYLDTDNITEDGDLAARSVHHAWRNELDSHVAFFVIKQHQLPVQKMESIKSKPVAEPKEHITFEVPQVPSFHHAKEFPEPKEQLVMEPPPKFHLVKEFPEEQIAVEHPPLDHTFKELPIAHTKVIPEHTKLPPPFPMMVQKFSEAEKKRQPDLIVVAEEPTIVLKQEEHLEPAKSPSFMDLTKRMLSKLHNRTMVAKFYLLGQMKPLADGSHQLIQFTRRSMENATEYVRSRTKPIVDSGTQFFFRGMNRTARGVRGLMDAKITFVNANGGEYLVNRSKKAFEGAQDVFEESIRKPLSERASKLSEDAQKAIGDAREWLLAIVTENSTKDIEASLHELEEEMDHNVNVTRLIPVEGPERVEEELDLEFVAPGADNSTDSDVLIVAVDDEESGNEDPSERSLPDEESESVSP